MNSAVLTDFAAVCRSWKPRVYAAGRSVGQLAKEVGIHQTRLSYIMQKGRTSTQLIERVEKILQEWERQNKT